MNAQLGAAMHAVHYVLLGAEFALAFVAVWAVIVALSGLFIAGQQDDERARYAKERGIK
jgi:hypothetical protein